MSRKWITAIKQLNKVQYFSEGSEIKVPLLKEQIDIESLNDKDNYELKDIFFRAIESIPGPLKEFIPKKLDTLYRIIEEALSLSELSKDGAGTGFVPEQDENCPVCGKNLVHFKKKPPFNTYFCPHVLLVTTPLFDGPKFSYVNKTMSEVADKLIKNDAEEHYKGLDEQMKEYADSSEGKYEVIKITNYNSKYQATSYYLIDMMGIHIIDEATYIMPEAIESWDIDLKEEYWNKVINRKRFDMDFAYHSRGELYSRIGEHQRAIDDYNEAIQVKPGADIYNDRGLSYSKINQFQMAIDDYNEAIRLKPDFDEAYTNRGDTYFQLSKYERAIEDYNEAIRLNPDNDRAFNKRGLVYKKIGEYDRAIKDYNEAIRLNPYGDEIHYHSRRFMAYYFNKACCLAIQIKAEESCKAIKYAVKGGFDCKNFNKDSEFDNIIKEPCFITLLKELADEYPWSFDRKEINAILKKAKKKI